MKALKQIVIDSFVTLLSPKAYFSALPKDGNLKYPILKIIIYGFLGTFIFSLIFLSTPGVEKYAGTLLIVLSLLSPFISIFAFLIGSIFVLILAKLCGAKADFMTSAKVTSSLAVTLPINAILAFFNLVSPSMGLVISILVAALVFWLVFNAIVYTFEANKKRSAIIIGTLLVLILILNILVVKAAKQIQQTNHLFGTQIFSDQMVNIQKH